MTREEIEELKGLAASMGLYDDKNPCKRAVILGKAIQELEQEPTTKNDLGVDAVSRQAVIDMTGLSEWFDSSDSYNEFVIALSYLPSVTPQQRWIPVSERLPKENICNDGYHEPSERVLAYMKSGEMHVARYWSRYDYKWLGIITPTTDEVIAWMPLPRPYEPQESEDT